jgi:hypothetical protein
MKEGVPEWKAWVQPQSFDQSLYTPLGVRYRKILNRHLVVAGILAMLWGGLHWFGYFPV